MSKFKNLMILAFVAGAASSVHAVIAFDSAADSIYTGGNVDGLNGGFGFGPWSALPSTNSSNAGNFQFTSSQNGSGASGNIDTAGRSWGLYANSFGLSVIQRNIIVPMVGIRIVELDFDNGFINNGVFTEFRIGTYTFGFKGGDANYYYDVGAGKQDSGLPFSADGLHAKLVLNGTGGWNFSVTSLATSSVWAAAQLSGAVYPTQISIFNSNAGPGASNNAYANSLKVTAPEPASMAALAMGMAALIRRRKS